METPESSALEYLRIVWRRKWLVGAAAVVAVLISVLVSARATPIYASASRILFSPQDTTVFGTNGRVVPDTAQIATQEQVITSPAIATQVAAKLGADAAKVTNVSAAGVGSTRVIEITVKATSAQAAARGATLYAEVYQQDRRSSAVAAAINLTTKLTEQTAAAKLKAEQLEEDLARAQANRAATSDIQSIKLQRDAATTTYILYQQRADQAAVDASVITGGVDVLLKGATPTTPISPRPRQSAALALSLGLLLGIVAAVALDFLDDSIKDVSEVERVAAPLAVLGAIPMVADWRSRELPRLITVEDPNSTVSESYRSLRTSVQFAALKNDARVIQMSSAIAAEGKTTTVANLAVTLAHAGQRVAVVDCDLRRPRVHDFFGVDHSVGFTSVLLGDQPLSRAVREIQLPGGSGMIRLLPSGPLPPNPAELLGTARVAELIASLAADADFVLIDAPPVLPVTDAIVLSSRVDGIMLVATSRVTGRRHLTQALAAFRAAEAPLLGVIVNGAAPTSSNYDDYYRYGGQSRENGHGPKALRQRVRT